MTDHIADAGKPIAASTLQELLDECEREKAARDALMPDERGAIFMLFAAYQRLKDFGWRDGMYAPKDGTTVQTISLGSTGIHDCKFAGNYWHLFDGGDTYPSSDRPDMFRLYPKDQAKADARMKNAAAKFARASGKEGE